MTQGNLSGKSRQQVEPDRPDHRKTDHVGDVKQMGIGNKGKGEQENQEEGQPELDKTGREDLFVVDVIFFEIATAHQASTYFIVRNGSGVPTEVS
jgi:hypothetical protein